MRSRLIPTAIALMILSPVCLGFNLGAAIVKSSNQRIPFNNSDQPSYYYAPQEPTSGAVPYQMPPPSEAEVRYRESQRPPSNPEYKEYVPRDQRAPAAVAEPVLPARNRFYTEIAALAINCANKENQLRFLLAEREINKNNRYDDALSVKYNSLMTDKIWKIRSDCQ